MEIKATTDDGKEGEIEISLEDEEDQIEYFEGVIVDMPEDGNILQPWLVDVLGLGEVDVYIIEVKGIPNVGDVIEIEGILADGSIIEAIIEVIEEEEDGELSLEIEGDAVPGNDVTLTEYFEGLPVVGAIVFLDDEEIGVTDVNGQLPFVLPEGVDEVEIRATYDGKEGEIEISFEEEEDGELSLEIEGDAVPGNDVTLTVTYENLPVEGATVFVDDAEVGETNSDGQLDVQLPEGVDEVEIKATTDDGKEGEIEVVF